MLQKDAGAAPQRLSALHSEAKSAEAGALAGLLKGVQNAAFQHVAANFDAQGCLPVTSPMVQFAASLGAVAMLVLLAHFLGFSRGARIESEAEARDLLRLAPGGFEPTGLVLDAQGRGAIAHDGDGRIALLLPHGGQFVARILPPDCHCTRNAGVLAIESTSIGPCAIALQPGETARQWAERIRNAG